MRALDARETIGYRENSKMEYREIEVSDIPEIFRIRVATWDNDHGKERMTAMGITHESVQEMLECGSHRGWLCEVEGNAVGFTMGNKTNGEMWVVAVLKQFEGKGIGGKLMSLVEEWLWSENWNEIWLTTDPDETVRAVGFYRHLGWEDWKVERDRYMRKWNPKKQGLGAMRLDLTTIRNASMADIKVIDDGIAEFNDAQPELSGVRPLSVVAKSCEGRVLAGTVGRTWGECCEIQQLWVSEEFRGRGIGKKLMMEFEQVAWGRGCRLIYLDTFTFQAPGFYQKLGYKPALVTRGYTAGIEKFTMHKTLTSQATEA